MKAIFFFLITFSQYSFAGDDFPRTGILPVEIDSSTDVRLGVAVSLAPCLGLDVNGPVFLDISDNNHITFVFVTAVVNPCPNVPGFGYQYNVGMLEPGSYTAQIYIANSLAELPGNINEPLGFELGQLLQFEVRGSGPEIVPSLSFWGFVILTFLLLITSINILKKRNFSCCR